MRQLQQRILRSHPIGVFHGFPLFIGAFLCWPVESGFAMSFTAKGRVTYHVFQTDGNIIAEMKRDFTVMKQDSAWRVETRPAGTNDLLTVDCFFDGTNIRRKEIFHRPSGETNRQPAGTHRRVEKLATEMVEIYPTDLPPNDPYQGFAIWLGYASQEYLSSRKGSLIENILNQSQRARYSSDIRSTRLDFIKSLQAGYWLPQEITLFNDGSEIGSLAPQGERKGAFPAPFNRGFVEGKYYIDTWNEVNGLKWPKRAFLERFSPKWTASEASETILISRYTIETTGFELLGRAQSLGWSLNTNGLTAVEDHRVTVMGTPVKYVSTGALARTDGTEMAALKRQTERRVRAYDEWLRGDDTGGGARRWLIPGLLIPGVVLLVVIKRRNVKRSGKVSP